MGNRSTKWWVNRPHTTTVRWVPMGEMVDIGRASSTTHAYLALPQSGVGPGLVVLQEWWGLVPHIMEVCDRFAAEGFVALSPDLYRGRTGAAPDEAERLMMALDMDRVATDLADAVEEARRRSSGRVGLVGFCLGGGLALLAATQLGDTVKATVPFYGVIPTHAPCPDWSRLGGPLQGHYAEDDPWAGPRAVDALRAGIGQAGGSAELFVYPGTEHAFFNDMDPAYDAAAAALAWDRTISFLHANL